MIDAAVAIKCFGVATSYLIIIGGLMPEAMQEVGASTTWQSRHLWIALCFAIVGPVAFQNSLEVLKFTSTMSITFVTFVTIVIIIFAFPDSGLDPCKGVTGECVGDKFSANPNTIEIFGVLPIFVFAFTCQQVCFCLFVPYIHVLHSFPCGCICFVFTIVFTFTFSYTFFCICILIMIMIIIINFYRIHFLW